nr:immunoglobulin light chain junction region [Macaca mulatta]
DYYCQVWDSSYYIF